MTSFSAEYRAEFWLNFDRILLDLVYEKFDGLFWRIFVWSISIFLEDFLSIIFHGKLTLRSFPVKIFFQILTDFWNWVTLKFVRPVPHRYIFLFDTLNDDAYETKAGADREQRRPLWFKFKSSAFHNLHKRWRGRIFPAKVLSSSYSKMEDAPF